MNERPEPGLQARWEAAFMANYATPPLALVRGEGVRVLGTRTAPSAGPPRGWVQSARAGRRWEGS
jgi:hypothetical protein